MQFPSLTPVVKNLLIINIIFFIATWVFESMGVDLVALLSAFYFDSPNFKGWQPLTYFFMHANIGHIFFNMFALVMFGSAIEQALGMKRFIEYYFITAIGALVLHMAVQALEVHAAIGTFTLPAAGFDIPVSQHDLQKVIDIYRTPVLGASGAVFGILLAFGFLFPNVELMIMFIPMPVKAKYVVLGYMAIELFSGIGRFQGDSVAHFAHLGGALFGFILLKVWGYRSSKNFL